MIKKILLILTLLGIISLACSAPTPTVITPTPIVITATQLPLTDTPLPSETAEILPTLTVSLTQTPDISETPTHTPTLGIAMVTPSSVNVNCRFGPSLDYMVTGALVVGDTVPITGKLANHTWWQINDPFNPGKKCWVSAAATTTSGNLAPVPVKPAPDAFVIDVSITAPDTIHGHCGGPNATSFEVSITTNGPTDVDYHMAIYNSDDSLRNETSTETLSFASADTQTFDPGGAYKTDCGDFYAVVFVTSPNNLSDRVDWSVVEP